MRHPGVPQNCKMGFCEMSSKIVVVVFGLSLSLNLSGVIRAIRFARFARIG